MERIDRTAFQGIANIVKFNWHYYAISLAAVAASIIAAPVLPPGPGLLIKLIALFIVLSILTSLAASYFIYDYSDFYSLDWLNNREISPDGQILNINAGFDETSWTLQHKFPGSSLTVLDFYDASKHTEISIERARKVSPKYPGTRQIDTSDTALSPNSVNAVFLIYSAHEIRDDQERVGFFRQLGQALMTGGQIIVVEHLRDWPNFVAYNIGAFHFLSKRTWKHTFGKAGLSQTGHLKINPFVSIYFLKKDGDTT